MAQATVKAPVALLLVAAIGLSAAVWSAPQAAAFGSVQYSFVADKGSASVSVIRLTSGALTRTITVGKTPTSVCLPSSLAFVAVGNSGDTTLSIIATSSWTVSKTVTGAYGNRGVATTSNGKYVFVSSVTKGLLVFTTTTWGVAHTVTLGTQPWGVATTASGRYVFVTQVTTHKLAVVTTASWSVAHTFTVGANPYSVATTSTGKFAAVANSTAGSVSIVTTSSWTVAHTVSVGGFPTKGVTVTPAGKYVAVHTSASAVTVITASSWSVVHNIAVGSGTTGGVAFTTGGKRLYADNSAVNTTSIITVASWAVSGTTTVGTQPAGVAMRPVVASSTAPPTIASATAPGFATTLDGQALTVSATSAIDQHNTAYKSGWNLSVTGTPFTCQSGSCAVGAVLASSVSVPSAPSDACDSGTTCTVVTDPEAYPVSVALAVSPPTATVFYEASATTGVGNQTVTTTWLVHVPSAALSGHYSSTWTITIANGP